jgi:hypothetical protein
MTAVDVTGPTRADPDRRRMSRTTGVLFLITFVASIPAAFVFYPPLLDHSHYVLGSGSHAGISAGALLELVTAAANIGTAVALFPLLRRAHEGLALGYVASRIVESILILVGVLSLLAVVTLRQELHGAGGVEAVSAVVATKALLAVHSWSFLLGPGILAGVGNGLMLGYLMYRTGLVPRRMALLGVIGGPLVALSGIAVLFGAYDQVSPVSGVATIPEFFWELSLGLYLTVKGFRPEAVARLDRPTG